MFRFNQPASSPSRAIRIDLWSVPLPAEELSLADFERLVAKLSDEERLRAKHFLDERDRRLFVMRRAARRFLLASALGVAPEAVKFARSANGKPVLDGSCELAFNASSSHALALVALADSGGVNLGVDVERIAPTPDFLDLARQFFSFEERSAILNAPVERRHALFFQYWTCKEAWLKGLGVGLSLPLDAFAVRFDSQNEGTVAGHDCWSLRSLDVGPGYAAALALDAAAFKVQERCLPTDWFRYDSVR